MSAKPMSTQRMSTGTIWAIREGIFAAALLAASVTSFHIGKGAGEGLWVIMILSAAIAVGLGVASSLQGRNNRAALFFLILGLLISVACMGSGAGYLASLSYDAADPFIALLQKMKGQVKAAAIFLPAIFTGIGALFFLVIEIFPKNPKKLWS